MIANTCKYLSVNLLAAAFACGSQAPAATLTRVYSMTVQNGGANSLIEGSPGLFYIASAYPYTVFTVTGGGVATTLATFANPPYTIESDPGVVAANGLLYSSVEQSSFANVFSVGSTPGTEKVYPNQSLAPLDMGNLPDGGLFGLSYTFTNQPGLGTVDLKGTVSQFYLFPANSRPGPPILGADGNYYGVSYTPIAGTTSYFYGVTPSGSFSQVASLPFVNGGGFRGDGFALQGTDGNFYGIQQTGGGCSSSNQHGAVYKLTPAGQFTILHDFGVCGKAIINTLIEGSDGNLYGAIEGASEIFSLTKAGSDYKVLASLKGVYGLCQCGLLQGSDGKIYGASLGGGANGLGTVFALDAGLPIPKPRAPAFYPKSGAVGTKVRIWGYNLFGASVQFNGVAGTNVYNAGPNYVWATVPAGATTGPITVTTPGGTSTTKQSFTVQ